MSQKRDQINRLLELAEIQWQAASQVLAIRTRDERAAAAAVRLLNEERETARAEANPADLGGMRALETWEAWSLQELARRNQRQAMDRAAMLRERAAAAVALSRRDAVMTLAKKSAAEAKQERAKRAEQALLDQQIHQRSEA